jgi:F-type H+-transporting ATPase subunit a
LRVPRDPQGTGRDDPRPPPDPPPSGGIGGGNRRGEGEKGKGGGLEGRGPPKGGQDLKRDPGMLPDPPPLRGGEQGPNKPRKPPKKEKKRMIQKINSPFEQFEIIRIIPVHPFGNLDISITNSTIFMIIAAGFFLMIVNMERGMLIPTRWQSVVEIIYNLIHGMIKENIGTAGGRFFPFVFTLFVFISLMNLFGLVPYTFTPTAHIFVTLGLSFSIWFACNIIGLMNHQLNFFSMFLPAGTPLWLAPFLILIEMVSHTAKAISLGVRLAANITAGHLLFAILATFTWNMFIAGGLVTVASLAPFAVVLFISGLEIAVSLIQAYVFCLLTCIYINDSIHLH